MTEQDPWATPPSNAANVGGMTPQYGAPPPPVGYAQDPPPYFGAPVGTQKNWMGITALILSLATFVVGFTWIGGIIFGHLGLAAVKRGEANNRSIALAGTIIGWVMGALTILTIVGVALFIFVASSDPNGY